VAWARTDPLVQPKQWRRNTRFGTRNVRSQYRSGSLTTEARELARYKLDLVGVQEVRWDEGGTLRSGDYICVCGRENKNHQLGTGALYTTKRYQQLRESSLLAIGYHIQF